MESCSYSSSTSESSYKRKKTNSHLTARSKSSLKGCVSLWKRGHAEKILGVVYDKRYTPAKDLEVIKSLGELSEKQKEYVDFVNKNLTFNLSLHRIQSRSVNAEKDIIDCATKIELLKDKLKPWQVRPFWNMKRFIVELEVLYENMKDYKKNTQPLEGFVTCLLGKFAELCCLHVTYCNDAHRSIWENLYGMKIESMPDLRLSKFGLDGTYSARVISVVEVKPDSCYNPKPMGPPKKRFKGIPRCSSSDTGEDDSLSTSEEEAIELALHDKVLGQHAGELLLDLHWKYGKYQENKFEDGKNIKMLGMIVDGTLVYFTVLEMTWKHYQKLKKNDKLDGDDKATIYYVQPKDILNQDERRTLIADMMRLNNADLF